MEKSSDQPKPRSRLLQPGAMSAVKKRRIAEPAASTAAISSAGKACGSTTQRKPLSSSVSTVESTNLFTVGRSNTRPVRNKAPISKKPVSGKTSGTVSKPSAVPKTSTLPKTTKPSSSTVPKGSTQPKRAAWDTKGKLEDLQKEFESFRRLVLDKENQNSQVVEEKEKKIVGLESKLSDELQQVKDSHEQERGEWVASLEKVKVEKEAVLEQLETVKLEKVTLEDRIAQLTQELRLEKKGSAMLRLKEKDLLLDIQVKDEQIQSHLSEISTLQNAVKEHLLDIGQLNEDKRAHEYERRRLHNTIQELKGNIRVYCRVRPCLQNEGEQQDIYSFPDLDQKKISLTKPQSVNESSLSETLRRTEKVDFTFDKIFTQKSDQTEIFTEISQLVQSALDGYNVCIFAYGQTGSGKTYTMQGPDQVTDDTQGVIPRSITQIFKSASQLEPMGWQYSIKASFLEIYNEKIYDLLGQPGSSTKHDIQTASGDVVVTNLTVVDVSHSAQVKKLMETAVRNRHVAETMLNARSSRSHSVFTLKISGHNAHTSESCVGNLHLIDLAGSERLKDSKATGDRLKETQSINTSLSALGNVIMSLAAKKSHVPFRDSKLTLLLQNSLGGNSKTLMFVNVSPRDEHFSESLNSLRFATKVNNCSIGTAKKVLK